MNESMSNEGKPQTPLGTLLGARRRKFGEARAVPPLSGGRKMIEVGHIKITARDQQVLDLLVQGCSNKEIAQHLNISPRTVKQHLRTLFLRAGIKGGRKRVKLATALYSKEESCSHASV